MKKRPMEAIVAVYSDWGIGADGTQPITVAEDRRHFVKLTKDAAVLYGRRTMEDFPNGAPLKNRHNIVVSKTLPNREDCFVASSLGEALMEAVKYEKMFIIGGASIYNMLFSGIDRVYVTKIDATPVSDVFFPNLDLSSEWHCVDEGEKLVSENGYSYNFCTYERLDIDKELAV